jgi:hypothetical protein
LAAASFFTLVWKRCAISERVSPFAIRYVDPVTDPAADIVYSSDMRYAFPQCIYARLDKQCFCHSKGKKVALCFYNGIKALFTHENENDLIIVRNNGVLMTADAENQTTTHFFVIS